MQIKYVKDEFVLSIPSFAFQFFHQLHNLPSALPTDYDSVHGFLRGLKDQIKNQGLTGYTKKTQTDNPEQPMKKRKLEEPGPSGLSGNHQFNNPSTVRQLLGAGYEVLREEEDPESGWALLDPVRSSFASFNSQAFNTLHS